MTEQVPGRGCAVGDFNNDGNLDIVVNCVNDVPQLLRGANGGKNRWIKLKLTGTVSNRSGIGARVYCSTPGRRQTDEVRSGGSYISQNDLRIHFGLGDAEQADLEIHWPSGKMDRHAKLAANRIHHITESRS